MRRRTLACALLPLLLAGCGGSGHKSSSTSGTDTIGPQIALAWPARARAFAAPVAATAARIVFPSAGANGNDISEVVLRPDGAAAVTKTYQLGAAIHPGRHLVRVEFLADSSSYDALGVAAMNVQVTDDGSLRKLSGGELGAVAFGSNVTALRVDSGQTVEVGQAVDLLVEATANGNTVALKPGSVTFALASGGLLALNADGSVSGVAEGTASLTARVDGVTSAAASVTVLPAPVVARAVPLVASTIVADPTRDVVYAALASNAVSGNSVVRVDAATGAVGTPIPVGADPNVLAASDDGTTLWVGLAGASAVRRVDLTTNTAGLQFSAPGGAGVEGAPRVTALAVRPGHAGTVAVCTDGTYTYGGGPTIYDGGVARPNALSGNQVTSLLWTDPSRLVASTLFGSNLLDIAVDDGGATLTSSVQDTASRLVLAAGRLYDASGNVYDAATFRLLGKFTLVDGFGGTQNFSGPVIDRAAKRAYFVENTYYGTAYLHVYDTQTMLPVTKRRIAIDVPTTNGFNGSATVVGVGEDRLAVLLNNEVLFLDDVSKL